MNFLVISRGSRQLVSEDDVLFILARDKYLELHTAEHVHLFEGTTCAIESNLTKFVRVHRNCLVKSSEIRGTRSRLNKATGDYERVVIVGERKEEISVSRRRYTEVRQLMDKLAGLHRCSKVAPPMPVVQ